MAVDRERRLGEQLRREIAVMLQRDVRDPRVGFPTPTKVDVTSDLSYATVHVMLNGEPSERTQQMEGLERVAPYLRRRLGEMLHIRKVPELRFVEDRASEATRRIEELLRADEPGPS